MLHFAKTFWRLGKFAPYYLASWASAKWLYWFYRNKIQFKDGKTSYERANVCNTRTIIFRLTSYTL